MAYITTEQVKEMRNELKSLFPAKAGWKLSVTREHYSSVKCSILSAPVELRNDTSKSYEGVNNFYIERTYADNPKALEVLVAIEKVLNTNNYNRSDVMADYFDCGHYIGISIGQWDKPFTVK